MKSTLEMVTPTRVVKLSEPGLSTYMFLTLVRYCDIEFQKSPYIFFK